MTHVRAQVRAAAVTLLTGLPTTGTRVFPTRSWPLSTNQLPALLIYTSDETAEPGSLTRPINLHRSVSLVVEAVASKCNGLDDLLDAMCAEVEAELAMDPSLTGLAKNSTLRRTEIEVRSDGDATVGIARMTFEVLYVTSSENPHTQQ